MTIILGFGLIAEALLRPATFGYALAFIVAGLVWWFLSVEHEQRSRERADAVRRAFGVTEAEVRSRFGLTEPQVTDLLADARELAAFSARAAGVGAHPSRAADDRESA